jgi:hypothetical protein
VLPRFDLMSTSRTPTEMISQVQFTYSSVSIHFVLVGAPLFLQDSLLTYLVVAIETCLSKATA